MSNASLAPATASARPLRIVSNLRKLSELGASNEHIRHDFLAMGSRPFLNTWRAHVRSLFRDAVLLHCPGKELFLLCALRLLLPWSRARLIAVDVILTRPGKGIWERLKTWVKGLLLRKVDLFLLHQKETRCLEEAYGIPPDRCRYIPFKVNSRAAIAATKPSEGVYVFTGGKSRRDYETFMRALEGLPYPALVLTPTAEANAYHDTVLDTTKLPANVRVVHDDGSARSFIDAMAGARLVVLPIRPDTLSPSGVGVYIMAMALRKCVIITDSPSTHGVLEHEENAVLVPPEDPLALREAIRKVWEDDAYRRGIAERAFAYAQALGGEEELVNTIAERSAAFLRGEKPS
jgi:glycosyltransferase involved in cell wall biosynthesis